MKKLLNSILLLVMAPLLIYLFNTIGVGFALSKSEQLSIFSYIVLISFFVAAILSYIKIRNDSKKAEYHLMPFKKRSSNKNANHLKKYGIVSLADVVSVQEYWDSALGSYCVIEYSFSVNLDENFIKIKKTYLPHELQVIPKKGDKIKILYEKEYPENSIISYTKADKAKWYQIQKTIKLSIINNN